MLRYLSRAALLAAACLILVGLAGAQSISTFKGKVIGVDGKPLKDAIITLERKEIRGTFKTKTDKKGEYIHAGIPYPGTYKITCTVDGKVVDTIDNVPAKLGDEVDLEFNLQKNAQKSAELAKAAESGTLTKEQERQMSAEQKAAMEKNVKERQATMAKNKALQDAYNAGMTALDAKDYQAAVDGFNKAAEVDPKQLAVWTKLTAAYEGLAKTKTGDDQMAAYTKAAEAYQKCIEMKPEDGGVHNNYGLLLVRMKKLDEAKAELAKAAELEPTNAGKYYFNLGAVMVNNQQNDAALEAFQKAVAADPKYAPAWYYIGNVLSNKLTMDKDGKPVAPAGMKEALEKYLELDPNGPYADASKGLLSVISTSIQTTYESPEAKKAAEKKKKK